MTLEEAYLMVYEDMMSGKLGELFAGNSRCGHTPFMTGIEITMEWIAKHAKGDKSDEYFWTFTKNISESEKKLLTNQDKDAIMNTEIKERG